MRDVPTLPPKAISIRQPWAYSIVHLGKRIENRTWHTRYRGPVAIHAAKGMTVRELEDWHIHMRQADMAEELNTMRLKGFDASKLERGGIVGVATIVGCITESDSPWFFGPVGIVLEDVKPVPFIPCKGALGFFTHGQTMGMRYDA